MKQHKKLTILAVIILLSGCNDFFMICSLNPFYTEKKIVLEPKMEGTWAADSSNLLIQGGKDNPVWRLSDTSLVWKITRQIDRETKKGVDGKDSVSMIPRNYYSIQFRDLQTDSTVYQFKMVLFLVKGVQFADIMPSASTFTEKSRMAKENYLMVHTLAKVFLEPNSIRLSWLSEECMRDMIENKHVRSKFVYSTSINRLLLTGSSERLYEMLERHAGEKRFIDWEAQPAIMTLKKLN